MPSRLGRTLALTISAVAITGCAQTAGFLRDSVTQVQVKRPNFRIVKTGLTATVDTGKALCLFPTDDAQVYRRLMENLHASAKLGQNQMLVNIREDIKRTFYLVFYCSEEHTLSADVVEFVPEGAAGFPPPPAPPPPLPAEPAPLPSETGPGQTAPAVAPPPAAP